jgi:3-deoxy-manno-octulosonate cytidylyltransferase (CMP-KDO synthetase)
MIVGIIPARFSSEEIECKVLKMIGDKPLIQHVYEACEKSNVLDDILVATDDERILNAVKAFNGKGILTSRSHI